CRPRPRRWRRKSNRPISLKQAILPFRSRRPTRTTKERPYPTFARLEPSGGADTETFSHFYDDWNSCIDAENSAGALATGTQIRQIYRCWHLAGDDPVSAENAAITDN